MADCHIYTLLSLGVLLLVLCTSAFPYNYNYDNYDDRNNAGEYNPYFQTGNYYNDDQNEVNYQGVGGGTGGSSSGEHHGGGGGGGGGGPYPPRPPTMRPTVRPTMRPTARPTARPPPPPTVGPTNPRLTTPCRGDTCGGGAPPIGPIPRNGPGARPMPRADPMAPVPRADPGAPIPRTDRPKIFTIANNIAKSQGGPLNMSLPKLVTVVSAGGILLVSAAGLTAYVMAKRR